MSTTDSIRTLVSVHDVMPETLSKVERILALLDCNKVDQVTLLVVPGAQWTPADIARLADWQAQGLELAGHGWHHRVDRYGGTFHRLHARFISRNVAEHLALDPAGIAELIERCHAWFPAQGLVEPKLYVPPAWAMGRIARSTLATLPFARYELLSGVLSARTGRFIPVPMTGYEADSRVRVQTIRLWNRINRGRAPVRGWLRIGIHPHDLDLRLADDLQRDLSKYRRFANYGALDNRCI